MQNCRAGPAKTILKPVTSRENAAVMRFGGHLGTHCPRKAVNAAFRYLAECRCERTGAVGNGSTVRSARPV
jgi:hypothetical protein